RRFGHSRRDRHGELQDRGPTARPEHAVGPVLGRRPVPRHFLPGRDCGPAGRTVCGTLTVREFCKPVSLAVGQVKVTGELFTASASIRVDRTEFGVLAMPGLARRYLDLTVEVRCTYR